MCAALAQDNFQSPAKQASPQELYSVQPLLLVHVKRRWEGEILFVLPSPQSSALLYNRLCLWGNIPTKCIVQFTPSQ